MYNYAERVSCVPGDVRLVNGSVPSEGRVEVCSGEVWGSISAFPGYRWLFAEAEVTCRQLGLPWQCK